MCVLYVSTPFVCAILDVLVCLSVQIEWILKDEVLAVCLQHGRPSEELLSRVIAHTSEAPRDGNCFKDQIPISFVFGVNRCQERFIAVRCRLVCFQQSLLL